MVSKFVPLDYPIPIIGIDDELPARINRNFEELYEYIKQVLVYENKTGIGINDKVNTDSPIWDRADNINPDGTFSTSKLTEKMVGLEHELQLADEAVTEAKIAVGAIKTPHLDDGCVTDMKLAAGAITEAKLKWQTHVLY